MQPIITKELILLVLLDAMKNYKSSVLHRKLFLRRAEPGLCGAIRDSIFNCMEKGDIGKDEDEKPIYSHCLNLLKHVLPRDYTYKEGHYWFSCPDMKNEPKYPHNYDEVLTYPNKQEMREARVHYLNEAINYTKENEWAILDGSTPPQTEDDTSTQTEDDSPTQTEDMPLSD